MFFHTSVQNKKEEERRKKEQELKEVQQQKQHAENILQQKFIQNPILSLLIRNIKSSNESWISTQQSYYDNRMRQITFEPDYFEIKWFTTFKEKTSIGRDEKGVERYEWETKEEIYEQVSYRYTSFGFVPLHGYEIDGFMLKTIDVLYLWARTVCQQMEQAFPAIEWSGDTHAETDEKIILTYQVEKQVWKEWM